MNRALLAGTACLALSFAGVAATANAASPPKLIASFTATPALTKAGGGTDTITAKLDGATECKLVLRSHPLFPVIWQTKEQRCKTTFTTYVKLGANPTTVERAAAFDIVATNGKLSSASKVFYLSIKPEVVVAPAVVTTVPAQTTTTTAPVPVIIPAGGGAPAPTPTTTPTTVAFTTTTTQPTTTTTAPTGLNAPIVPENSSNWSGYELNGGPYTTVTGTFTVPTLVAPLACEGADSEWVGVDGVQPNDDYLLQAGVGQDDTEMGCQTDFYLEAWWESISPTNLAPQQDENIVVNPGDTVTVTLSQISAGQYEGYWAVEVLDQTNGQGFTDTIGDPDGGAYQGPASSTEWVTEAVTVTGQQTTLAPYCTVPPGGSTTCTANTVTFSGLGTSPINPNQSTAPIASTTSVDAITMVQNGDAVSTPSTVANLSDLLANGFTTTYTGP